MVGERARAEFGNDSPHRRSPLPHLRRNIHRHRRRQIARKLWEEMGCRKK